MKFFRPALLPLLALLTAACADGHAPHAAPAQPEEMILGSERIEPGIRVITEGAIRDTVHPGHGELSEKETDVHLEARITWDSRDIPTGAQAGAFVPYLSVTAKVTNERTGKSMRTALTPHLNLGDHFHYARNLKLPGSASDRYTVSITVAPPKPGALHYHYDWNQRYGSPLFEARRFTYRHQDFREIAAAHRR